MTQAQTSAPAHNASIKVAGLKMDQGIAMQSANAYKWAFTPEIKLFELSGGECTGIRLSPARDQNSWQASVDLLAPWRLPAPIQDAVIAVSGELTNWIFTHSF